MATQTVFDFGSKIITRQEALARGLPRYFTGKPCKRGHIEERYVANNGCRGCLRKRPLPTSIQIVDFNVEIITRADAIARGLTQYFTGKPCSRGHVAIRYVMGECRACRAERSRTPAWRKKRGLYRRGRPLSPEAQKRHRESGARRRAKDGERLRAEAKTPAKKAVAKRRRDFRLATEPDFKLLVAMRTLIAVMIRRMASGVKKAGHTNELVGCTLAELREHIERQFRRGMSWANYGAKWQIDHIIPCKSFDLSDPSQQRACFHFTNLRPLGCKQNLDKRDRRELLL